MYLVTVGVLTLEVPPAVIYTFMMRINSPGARYPFHLPCKIAPLHRLTYLDQYPPKIFLHWFYGAAFRT